MPTEEFPPLLLGGDGAHGLLFEGRELGFEIMQALHGEIGAQWRMRIERARYDADLGIGSSSIIILAIDDLRLGRMKLQAKRRSSEFFKVSACVSLPQWQRMSSAKRSNGIIG